MRRFTVLLLAVAVCIALPLFAQEKKDMAPSAMPPMPKPLNDDLLSWMVGEWEGTTTMSEGKSQDWQKVEWGLDNQFIMTTYSANLGGTMVYKGTGPTTVNPQTGEVVGYWFDNMRGMYKGTGKREGNKIMMTWEGTMGTRTDTTEKVGDDKFVVTFSSKDPSGKVSEGRTELSRKKTAMK